ncbi:hypothetical protein BGY98DRAFT_204860 [Russula aff. rugulosa BPL654]|nr:hypothetical protein BGY98DRAFT_204860 [Russula aff. rugulosa BPL654]
MRLKHHPDSPFSSIFISLPAYMTDWDDPAVILSEYFGYVNIVHVMFGVYIWEIIMSIDFDYAILARKRQFRSSFLLYFGARWFPLIALILEMLGQDEHYLNCQLYVITAYLCIYLGFLFASSLVVLRVVAIWERNKIVIAIAACSWLSNLGTCIYCVATTHTIWIAPLRICGISEMCLMLDLA